MSWQKEWEAIDQTIVEFSDICKEFVIALSTTDSDSLGTMKNIIIPMAQDIASRLSLLIDRYETQLPENAIQRVREFSEKISFESAALTASIRKSPTSVTYFSSEFQRLKSDFNYYTSELEGSVLRHTERAFIHLQRSIVVDDDIRKKWINAFNTHETNCEKLGSVHLLLHGIWSFKSNSEGERTDLILGEPIKSSNLDEIYLAAEGLVLTEWKVVKATNSQKKYTEALTQAKLYSTGSLAPIELKTYRYLVIVSDDVLIDLPDDTNIEGVTYRYINIAVNPSTPSKIARK